MNTRQLSRLPRPYAELDTAFTRHQKAKSRLKNLIITAVIVSLLILAVSWLYPRIRALQESRAKDRYEEIHKIVLDGRGPALKKVMREAVKP